MRKRLNDRMMSAQTHIKFDLDKCPLLSYPSESYKKTKLTKLKASGTDKQLVDSSITNTSQGLFDFLNSKSVLMNTNDQENVNKSAKLRQAKKSSCLRLIYSQNNEINNNLSMKKMYDHFTLDQIADIFLNFTLFGSFKYMSHSNFRLFVK